MFSTTFITFRMRSGAAGLLEAVEDAMVPKNVCTPRTALVPQTPRVSANYPFSRVVKGKFAVGPENVRFEIFVNRRLAVSDVQKEVEDRKRSFLYTFV